MEISFEYAEEEATGLPEAFFRDIARQAIEAAALPSLAGKAVSLSAVAVSEERIRELNRSYRSKDSVTDVLSFGEYQDTEALAEELSHDVFIGELFFSPAFIRSAAVEDGVSLEQEMAYVFSHGVLHLLGFDHCDEMFALQDGIADRFASAA